MSYGCGFIRSQTQSKCPRSLILCSGDVFADCPTQVRQAARILVREDLAYPGTRNQPAQSLKFFGPHGAIEHVGREGIGDERQNGALRGERLGDWGRIRQSLAQNVDRLQWQSPGLETQSLPSER